MSFLKFVENIKQFGVAKESRFTCEIIPPPFMINAGYGSENLHLYCDSVQFPEMALATSPVKDAGLTREVVYDKMYGAITPRFICDQKMSTKMFFDAWIAGTVRDKGGTFNYPDSYKSERIIIDQLDAQGMTSMRVVLYNAYPKVVNDAYMSASGKGVLTFQVEFTYTSWDSVINVSENSTIEEE